MRQKKRASRAGKVKSPKEKYLCQKWRAKVRGVPWEISFEDWWAIWDASGKYHLRGIQLDNYVMARFGDKGPYHKDNVRICTVAENNAEYQAGRTKKKKHPKRGIGVDWRRGTGKGWHFRDNKYVASFRGKKIGRFNSEAEAHEAYLCAVMKYSGETK